MNTKVCLTFPLALLQWSAMINGNGSLGRNNFSREDDKENEDDRVSV